MISHIAGFFNTLRVTFFDAGVLSQAILDGKSTAETLLLINPTSVNEKKNGKTPLHIAFERTRIDLIEPLLTAGANPFVVDDQTGDTAAHLALRTRQTELFKRMLHPDVTPEQINCQNSLDGTSLLLLASRMGDQECVAHLLERGANANLQCSKKQWSPLHAAAAIGHVAILRLLARPGLAINCVTTNGETPLFFACAAGNVEAAQALLVMGADSNFRNGKERNWTPMHLAAQDGRPELITLLAHYRADPHAPLPPRGCNPLFIASEAGKWEAVNALLQVGAKIDDVWQNQTPLHVAINHGHEFVVKALLDRGINAVLPIYKQIPPLLQATQLGRLDVTKQLLAHRFNADELHEPQGESALHMAAKMGIVSHLQLFCESDASLTNRTKNGKTALYLACEAGAFDTAKLLIEKGAPLEEKCGAQEKTALQIASEKEQLLILPLLLDAGAKFTEIDRRYSPRVIKTYLQHHHTKLKIALEMLNSERSLKTQSLLIEGIQRHFTLEALLAEHHRDHPMEQGLFERTVLGTLELQEHFLQAAQNTFHERFGPEAFSKALVVLTRQHTILQLLTKTAFFPALIGKTATACAIIISEKFKLAINAQYEFFKETKEKFCKEQKPLEALVVSSNEWCAAYDAITKIYGYYFHDPIRELYCIPIRKHIVENQMLRQDCVSIIKNLQPRNRRQEYDEEDVFGIFEKIVKIKQDNTFQNDVWASGLREGKDLRLIGIDDDLLILLQDFVPAEILPILHAMKTKLLTIPNDSREAQEAKDIAKKLDSIISLFSSGPLKKINETKEQLTTLHKHYCSVILHSFLRLKKAECMKLLKMHQCESLSDLQKKLPLLKFDKNDWVKP